MAFASLLLVALTLFIGWVMLRDTLTGRGDMLSIRNFFFLGFLLFQCVSGLWAIVPGDFGDYSLRYPDRTSIIFAVSSWAFILIFMGVYGHGFIVKTLAHKLPGENAAPATASLLILAAIMLGSGILFKQVLTFVPIFGPLSDKIGGAQLALAVGLAMWAWAPRLLNPIVAAYAGAIILVAIATSLVGTYGRRDLVSVLAAVPWALYHAWWKSGGFAFAFKRIAVFGAGGLIVLAAYTAVRTHKAEGASLSGIAKAMTSADIGEGINAIASGQLSANISMWIIETRPEPYSYDTLHAGHFFSTMIVPRQFYQNKPIGLGLIVPQQIELDGKGEDFNVGPGVVGHIFNDNPWIAMWLYPAVFALFMRFADEAIRSRYYSPFIILPMGAALGELAGLARGDIGLFGFNIVISVIAAYVTMVVIRVVLSWFGWRPVYEDAEGADWFDEHNPWGHHESSYDDYADYSDDYDDYEDDSQAA